MPKEQKLSERGARTGPQQENATHHEPRAESLPSHLSVTPLIQRARRAPGPPSPGEVLQLQRTLGNRATTQLLAGAGRPAPAQGSGSSAEPVGGDGVLPEVSHSIGEPAFSELTGIVAELEARLKDEKTDPEFVGFYKVHNEKLNPWLEKMKEEAQKPDDFGLVKQAILTELENMTQLIRSGIGPLALERPKFGEESFAQGLGVRKDTYIPPIVDEQGESQMSVAELRSGYAINKFFETT